MKISKIMMRAACTMALIVAIVSANAQTIVRGYIRDSITQMPLAFVSVYFQGGKGVVSNNDGSYIIEINNPKLTTLVFSNTGYKKITQKIVAGKEQTLDIYLHTSNALTGVTIKAKRGKYRNKDNPAVELIEHVIENKKFNKITAYDYVQYEQYEKMALSLANKPEKLAKNRLFKNYKFILENIDTNSIEGKGLIPIYLQEKLSQNYYRKSPANNKAYIIAKKKVNYGEFLDESGITNYLESLYADINIYDNNVSILNTQFLSPIADMAPTFYRFFITDTVEVDGIKLVKLNFMPRNTADLLFKGIMYVTLDGKYGVQKINLAVSKKANLNWARDLRIKQDFEKSTTDGRYHVISSDMKAEFTLRENAQGSVLGERSVSFKNFVVNTPAADSVYGGDDEVELPAAAGNLDSFWIASRHQPLSAVQAKVYSNIDSLRNMKSFKNTMEIAMLIFSGYKKFGPVEVGNTNTFYSFDPVEGFRLKLGGRTTPEFSRHFYLEGYGVYGFKDKQYKYLAAGAYSFNAKSIYGYPLNYIKFIRQYETQIPGQELLFAAEDNIFLSFKRGKNDKWLYNDIYKVEYVNEFAKNFSIRASFKNELQTPAGSIQYEKPEGAPGVTKVDNITTSKLEAELRWAPREQFYQGKNFRRVIHTKFPIFTLRLEDCIKGLFGGQYNYQQVTLAIAKRNYLSQLGYADLTVEAGHVFGQVPYPLLNIHRANQSYAYQVNAYNLMNFLEFVSDNYAAANTDFYFNGFFFNKIPLLKRLKFREVASFKVLMGGVRAENNPTVSNGLFKFPTELAGGVPVQSTFALNGTPYMEVSVGVANILKILRLDLVKRLTYLDHPNVSSWAIRARVRAEF